MKRSLFAAVAALALDGPMLVLAAPDEAQKQLMQRERMMMGSDGGAKSMMKSIR